jgi:hypothetical protein
MDAHGDIEACFLVRAQFHSYANCVLREAPAPLW